MKKFIPIFLLGSLFIHIGTSQNIWEPTAGPQGLNVRLISYSNDHAILVSAYKSGLFLSEDQGTSWFKKSNGLNAENSVASSIASSENGEFWAIIDNALYYLNIQNSAWIKLNDENWENYYIIRSRNGLIYLGKKTAPILWKYSSDGGKTFLTATPNKFVPAGLAIFNGNGNNFMSVSEGDSTRLYKISDSFSDLQQIYSANWRFQFYAHDTGTIFLHQPAKGLFKLVGGKFVLVDSMQFSKSLYLVVSLKPDGSFLAFDYSADYHSDIFGKNWVKMSTISFPRIYSTSQVTCLGDQIYVRGDACQFPKFTKSNDDNTTWTSMDRYFSNPDIEKLQVVGNNEVLAAYCEYGRYAFSGDGGLNWKEINPTFAINNVINIAGIRGGKLIASTLNELYSSLDMGNSWNSFNVNGKSDFMKVIGDGDRIVFLIDQVQSYISFDGGFSWQTIAKAPDAIYGRIQLYAFPNANFIFFANLRNLFYIYEVLKDEWKGPFSAPSLPTAVHVTNSGKTYISLDRGTYLVDDKLDFFEYLSDSSFFSITSDIDDNLYALGRNSMTSCVKSKNGGHDWEPFDVGLPNGILATSLAIDQDQYLYASFEASVVYKTIKPVTNTVSSKNAFSDLKLSIQSNPADLQIRLTINNGQINLPLEWQFFNLNNEKILCGETDQSSWSINVEHIPNGIYFVKFSDPRLQIKKIIVQHN